MDHDDGDPIDLAPYLLRPPPSAAQLARRDRVRAWVRWGSVGACAVVALLLVLPGGADGDASATKDPVTDEQSAASFEAAGVGVEAPADDPSVGDDTLPRRVDVGSRARRPVARASVHASRRTSNARSSPHFARVGTRATRRARTAPAPVRRSTPDPVQVVHSAPVTVEQDIASAPVSTDQSAPLDG